MTHYSTDDGEPRPVSGSDGADRYEVLLQVLEQQSEQARAARARTPGDGDGPGAKLKLGLAIALAALSA